MARGWGRVDVRPDRSGTGPAVAAPVRAVSAGAAGLVLAALAGLAAPTASAPPAGAHAQVVGSAPEDGETVGVAPAEVSVVFDAKPVTVEGDPLRVVAPDGRRVDTGVVRAGEGGRTLTVGLASDRTLPSGEYQIAYRVVSTDSHVIAGRLSFSTRQPSPGDGPEGEASAVGTAGAPAANRAEDGAGDAGPRAARRVPDRASAPDARLTPGSPDDARPRLVAAGALVLAAIALVLALVRRPSRGAAGHRSAGTAASRRAAATRHRAGPDRPSLSTAAWSPPPGTASQRAATTTAEWPAWPPAAGPADTAGGPRSPGSGPADPDRPRRQPLAGRDPFARQHSRRARARARRQRPGRRSSPVDAGLRLPPAGPAPGGAPTAPGEPPAPVLVAGRRRRPWSQGAAPPPRVLPSGPDAHRSLTAPAPWRPRGAGGPSWE